MSEIFLKIINMSISASYIVLAVLLLRLLLKKAPKWITVVLWGIVAVRLVCPFSIESALSLIPSSEVVSPEIMTDSTPEISTGILVLNQAINPVIGSSFAPDPATSANPLQLWIPAFAIIWIIGMVALLVYTVISYAKLKHKVGTAVSLRDNVYQSENVASPFVLGIIKPKIYLPFDMNEKDMGSVVAHEAAHIRRKDHLWKPLGFLILTLHWFNPLMWLGYILLCRDIELACDEKVIKELDRDARADYSEALLTCSVSRRTIAACPLAFGEVGVKGRVKSVLSYKKPAFWIIVAAVVACVAVAACFLTNPKADSYGGTDPNKLTEAQASLVSSYPEYFGLDSSAGLDVYVWQMAESSYSFGLLPHSEHERDSFDRELCELRGTNTDQMRIILSTYNIDEDDIHVILWQHPLSSYLAEWQIIREGESTEEHKAKGLAYAEEIRAMLLEAPEQNESSFAWNFPLESDSDKFSSIHIQDLGCDVKDVKIAFEKARFEDGELVFDIRWTNESAETIDIGPDFEVYKYNGSTLEKLENKGAWNYYRDLLAGKGTDSDAVLTGTIPYETTASYNLSAHYDVLVSGKYRLEVHGAWVEFNITTQSGQFHLFSSVYDAATFDVDGDGKEENCCLCFGHTSGLFTFIFSVKDKETGDKKYETTIYSQVYKLSFQKGSDGKMKVQGITSGESPETHLFDISIKDGDVYLTENGTPIGEIYN